MNSFVRGFAIRSLSLLVFAVFWQLAVIIFEPSLLPTPVAVITSVWHHTESGELPHHLAITLRRVFVSFSIAMVLGMLIGLLLGHYKRLDDWLDGIVTLALNIPALVTIILCFIWFGLTEVAAIVAVIVNKTPNVIVTFREGAKNIDNKLLAVARVYQIPFWRMLRFVYFPQLYPYFLAASRSGLALVWKIVLVAELLGCSNGIGFQLGIFFQYFDITSILAYTVAFAAIVYIIEGLLIRPWERSVTRWRT